MRMTVMMIFSLVRKSREIDLRSKKPCSAGFFYWMNG